MPTLQFYYYKKRVTIVLYEYAIPIPAPPRPGTRGLESHHSRITSCVLVHQVIPPPPGGSFPSGISIDFVNG